MKSNRNFLPFLSVLLAMSALAGCGGGGSSSNSAPTLGTQTRLVQPGDMWVYDVTGNSVGGGNPVTASGTITFAVSNKPFNGGTALALDQTQHLVSSDGRITDFLFTKYISQDATTHEVKELGESDNGGSISTAVNRPTIFFGSWSNGETLTPTFDFGGGDVQNSSTETITGSETVQTPAGSFNAWKVSSPSPVNASPNPLIADWAPQLGAPVRFDTFYGYSSSSGDVTIRISAILKSTTVPH